MIAPDDLIAQAREWIGIKFLHQGRSRFGCDCLGFVAGVLGELGSMHWLDVLPKNYSRAASPDVEIMLAQNTRRIELQPAALIVFRWPGVEFGSHCGIFTGENLIHSFQTEGKVIEHGYRGPWVKRTTSIWALPEVVYR